MNELSHKERFLRSLRRESLDRVPVPAFCTHPLIELMDQTGLSAPDIHFKLDDMVSFSLAALEVLGFEGVRLPTDGVMEAEAIGCPIDKGARERNPAVAKHPFSLETLNLPVDFMSKGRIPLYLEALKTVRFRVGDNIPVTAHLQGPMSLANHLLGSETLLLGLVENREQTKVFLNAVSGVSIKLGKALIEAGADVLMVPDPMASTDIISPAMFKEFVQPCYKKIFREFSCPVVLHICGNTKKILPFLKGIGAAGFSFDSKVSVSDAKMILGDELSLVGNVSTLDTLLSGTTDDVRQVSMKAISDGVDVLAPSCGFAPGTPLDNIREMIRVAKSSSEYNRS